MKGRDIPKLTAARVAAIALGAALAGGAAEAYDDSAGRRWVQVAAMQGLSWNQIALVCALDGVTACAGRAGGLADPASVPFANGEWMWQPTAAVAEPASTTLTLAGLVGRGWWLRRRQPTG